MPSRKKILVFIIAAVMTAGIISSVIFIGKTTPAKPAGFDLQALGTDYGTITMNCKYDDKQNTLTVAQTVEYLNKSTAALTEVKFHIYANAYKKNAYYPPVTAKEQSDAYPNGFSEGYITINSVNNGSMDIYPQINGTDNTVLTVPLQNKLKSGDKVTITIGYVVKLANIRHRLGYANGFVNLGNFYPVPVVFENGIWQTYPYSSNGDPFYNDLYNFNVTVDTPAGYTIAASGDKIKPGQYRAYAIRDFAMVLSKNFKTLSKATGDTTVTYYYVNDDTPEISLQTAVNALAYFSNEFYDYPYKTLSVVQTEFLHGGMEYGTLVYISLGVASDTVQYQTVIVHEIAHQWWYGIVGNNQTKTAWIDEGLAEYSTAVFFETHPEYDQTLDKIAADNIAALAMYENITAEFKVKFNQQMNRDLNSFNSSLEYTFDTYVRGMLLYYNLAEMVGYEKLNEGLSAFANSRRFNFGTQAQLISCLEVNLAMPLTNYFNNYLAGAA